MRPLTLVRDRLSDAYTPCARSRGRLQNLTRNHLTPQQNRVRTSHPYHWYRLSGSHPLA